MSHRRPASCFEWCNALRGDVPICVDVKDQFGVGVCMRPAVGWRGSGIIRSIWPMTSDSRVDVGTVLAHEYPEDGGGSLDVVDAVESGVEHHKVYELDCICRPWDIREVQAALRDGLIVGVFYWSEQLDTLDPEEIFTGAGRKEELYVSPDESIREYEQHAVCITGFRGRGLGGYFNFANSWGEDWCDGGYGGMQKDVVNRFIVPVVHA
ncbi:hypothetical protein Tsubulata_012184 [Turnera subulata]|uniref:Peptidase C1A papain C-terminal domain-containing protein n=1 Tax=Turnera subulata TaxID=218843 RepID=A0A9Q0F213_9ROSI|nr:hypothetical protein Tsubulata_012184 [Turnera subulata]